MKQSPTNVMFHYQNPQQQKYYTKFIHAGYVVGQPIAYHNVSKDSFSPTQYRSRAFTSMHLNNSVYNNYQAPQPSKFALPLRHSLRRMPQDKKVVSIQQYNQLLEKHIELDRKYWDLSQKYKELLVQKKQISSTIIEKLIQKYKQNMIKEAMLLVDHVRLTYKEKQLYDS